MCIQINIYISINNLRKPTKTHCYLFTKNEKVTKVTDGQLAKRVCTIRRLADEALAKVRRRQASDKAEAKEPAETFLQPDGPPQQQQ